MAMIEYLTDAGREMLSQMIAGKKTISYTKIQMGDGVITTSHDKRTMTSLINPIVTLDVESVAVTSENVIKITGVFSNESLTSGFYYREKAIFASDGENEILFSYANAGSESEWIEPPTVEIIEKKIMSLYKEFQDTETDLKIQIKSGIYVATDDFNAALKELEGKYAKKDLYDDTTVNLGRLPGSEKGDNSVAIGKENTASGSNSFASGLTNTASGRASHAEGHGCVASGGPSDRTGGAHAEGNVTTASGTHGAHSEGYRTTASGNNGAHAEGHSTEARGSHGAHSEGYGTIATGTSQHVEGKYNVEDTEGKYAHIIGNGASDTERSNTHTVDWEGNAWYAGDVINGNNVSLDGLQKDIEDLNSNLDKLNTMTQDVDYSIISKYSNVITKQENYSYRVGNVVTLNISVKFSGDITSYDPILTIEPAPKRITYCQMQSVSDGSLIPAFIESEGSLKIRFSKTLSGFYGIQVTYSV